MVRHDWMLRVYQWMGVPEKVVNVLSHLMKGWKTRLEVTDKGETKIGRWIKIRKGFLQGDSYFPVGFCLTEMPVTRNNVCNLRKGDLEELDKFVKTAFRKQGFHGKQASDERLYEKRDDGGRELKSFK
ncbi:Hypothetical predicted protein [Paramuricea clavata]|uniref:Uncharacterized protein n=1 Tax=Paramuricea clavata TaxID=317549 RepID=A0A6S7GWJ1_PARCT|nr:Hypothetical predicted protein [Paramuricea clavata]